MVIRFEIELRMQTTREEERGDFALHKLTEATILGIPAVRYSNRSSSIFILFAKTESTRWLRRKRTKSRSLAMIHGTRMRRMCVYIYI